MPATITPASGAGEAHDDIIIIRNGTQPSVRGPDSYFTGTVRIDQPFAARPPSRTSGAFVTFEPGARTAWHTHPYGQHLVVTFGLGLVQEEGGPVETIRNGDTVFFPPGVKHWHGAGANTAMTYIAIAEEQDKSPVTWLEQVTDEQYASVLQPDHATSERIGIMRNGDRPSVIRSGTFTGHVRGEPLSQPEAGANVHASMVTFDPGARTDWHTHPHGQTLLVMYGRGHVQQWGGGKLEIFAGDIVWFPSRLKHWHGARKDNALTHIALSEPLDGQTADWMEKVTDQQYEQ